MNDKLIDFSNKDAERALVGSAIVANGIPPEVTDIQPGHFYYIENRAVWQALQGLAGKDVDPISLENELTRINKLRDVKLADVFEGLFEIPNAQNIETYAAIVREHADRRRMVLIHNEMGRMVYGQEPLDIAALLNKISMSSRPKADGRSMADVLQSYHEEVLKRSQNPGDVWGLRTGFHDLDERIGGLEKQQSMLIAAPPGAGKSVLAMQSAQHMAKGGARGIIFSFEMRGERVAMRLLSSHAKIPTRAMRTGHMENYWTEFYNGVNELSQLPIIFYDLFGMTTAEVRGVIARAKAKDGLDFIVVDYLDKLLDTGGESDAENTAIKGRKMQSILREFDIAGIFIQSMNKEGMKATIKTMDNVSGSANLMHEVDNAFLLGKDPDDKTDKTLLVLPAKLRDGDKGNKPMRLRWADGFPMLLNTTERMFDPNDALASKARHVETGGIPAYVQNK